MKSKSGERLGGEASPLPSIDLAEFERNYIDLMEDLPELLDKFTESKHEHFLRLDEAIQNRDSSQLCRYAHSLRGMLAQVYALAACEIMSELEVRAKVHDFVKAAYLLTRVRDETSNLDTLLRDWMNGRRKKNLA